MFWQFVILQTVTNLNKLSTCSYLTEFKLIKCLTGIIYKTFLIYFIILYDCEGIIIIVLCYAGTVFQFFSVMLPEILSRSDVCLQTQWNKENAIKDDHKGIVQLNSA